MMRKFLYLGLFTFTLFILFSYQVSESHIIPPEKFHPVADAYRRMMFGLNLNPIRWDLKQEDVKIIARELGKISATESKTYLSKVNPLITKMIKMEGLPSKEERKNTARLLFEENTKAVTKTLIFHLVAAQKNLKQYSLAFRHLNEARQIWASFEHEIKATDYPAFLRMGRSFLELATSLGNPGILTVGYEPTKRQIFQQESQVIIAYIDRNFGDDYEVGKSKQLAPLPRKSNTFNPKASIPPKLPPGADINKQVPRPRQILNMTVRGVDESETPLIALGDMAFDSTYIFGEPARSFSITCNTCHNKGVTNPNFFIPELSTIPGGMDVSNSYFAPHANNGHFGQVDIPDLRGIRFTAPYGRNGRFSSLREFTRNVIVNEFNGQEPDPLILDGLVAYMLEFDFLPNPKLSPDGRLSDKASTAAKRGEKIFHKPYKQMGERSCATCHIPSNQFLDHQQHNIGTVSGAEAFSQDRALDTPTLLSAKFSAPYFHDGSQPTLQAVNEWFNENFRLGLNRREISDLTSYLETIANGQDPMEETIYILDAELEEFSFFLSAYEFLKKVNKPDLITITFQTISEEIKNHQWELQDPKYHSTLLKLASLMDEAVLANKKGNGKVVDQKVNEYRNLYAKNVEVLK